MSGINGDKSRFHRKRKQKIARRQKTRELSGDLAKGSGAQRSAGSKQGPVSK
jgi:hypothetical protein